MRCLPDFPCPAVAELHFSMLNVSSAVWQPPPEALLPFPSPDNALPRNTTVSSGLFSTALWRAGWEHRQDVQQWYIVSSTFLLHTFFLFCLLSFGFVFFFIFTSLSFLPVYSISSPVSLVLCSYFPCFPLSFLFLTLCIPFFPFLLSSLSVLVLHFSSFFSSCCSTVSSLSLPNSLFFPF